jgi:hypothetical protein
MTLYAVNFPSTKICFRLQILLKMKSLKQLQKFLAANSIFHANITAYIHSNGQSIL